jgi:rhamnogalacturonan endolyase
MILSALATFVVSIGSTAVEANIAGGGTGTGANVTVVDNGDGTVTMANGIVSMTLNKTTAHVTSIIYTTGSNNVQMLQASNQWYYGGTMLGAGPNGPFTYTLAVNPTSNGGASADLQEISTTSTTGVMTSDWVMLKGSPGFYTSCSMSHRSQDAAFNFGAFGLITRVPAQFNWVSQDTARNFLDGTQTTTSAGSCVGAPHEASINANGSQAGEFSDKFIYGQDHKDLTAWGWSSVGSGNLNVGDWLITNMQFSDGGPLKRDVFSYPYNNLNNSMDTNEVGMGSDGTLAAGEIWNKTIGPWFMYFNTTTTTGTAAAANALFTDAKNQATAEAGAWPYSWFSQEGYVGASGRGTVKGTLSEVNPNNHNITVAGTWVGLYQQPITSTGAYDFQRWLKPYQYWTTTDSGGNFTIPNVIAGSNYTLWAYSPGMPGTFLSQNQTGGNPPLVYTLPSTPFGVSVPAGGTNNLGTITWTSPAVGPTVFEIGYPDRKADKFRHGEDFFEPEASPQLGYPTPIWGCQMRFPLEYPSGEVYNVGTSQWPRDWNYVLPSDPDVDGTYSTPTATINFNLATTPGSGATASVYLGLAQDDGEVLVSINGTNLGTASGVTASPNAISSTGFTPPYPDDSSIHFSNHGPFSDERITFPASLLHSGSNSLTIKETYANLVGSLMVDYLRMELTGYVPPPPTGVTTHDGNGRNMVTWNAVPGATRYVISRSTTSGSGYTVITSGFLTQPAGGSGQIVLYEDTTAENGTEYYYVVQSYSPYGTSAYSAQVSGEAQGDYYSTAPDAPTGLAITNTGDRSISLSWDGDDGGTSLWSVYRTTLVSDNSGDLVPLRTILLDNSLLPNVTTYTDNTVSNAEQYSYYIVATDPEGSSGPSNTVTGEALPPAPDSAPEGFTAIAASGTAVNLSWSPVTGAEGYDVYRSTTANTFSWPANFVATTVQDTYADSGLSPGVTYYYRVTPVNAGGIGPDSTDSATTP